MHAFELAWQALTALAFIAEATLFIVLPIAGALLTARAVYYQWKQPPYHDSTELEDPASAKWAVIAWASWFVVAFLVGHAPASLLQ